MANLQFELARLSSDPGDIKPGRNLVRRVELKMADVMAALQWFEYHNKLDVDSDRLEHCCETFDANHKKPVPYLQGQTHMRGIVMSSGLVPTLVSTLSDDIPFGKHVRGCMGCEDCHEPEPPTRPSPDIQPDSSTESAEISHGSR